MTFPFLGDQSRRQLDTDLEQLLQLVDSTAAHGVLSKRIFDVIKSVTGKLVRPGWEAHWVNTGSVSWGWLGDISHNRAARALHEVFSAMVAYIKDAPTVHLQRKLRRVLRDAVCTYLSLQDVPVHHRLKPKMAADPFADLTTKQRRLIRLLQKNGGLMPEWQMVRKLYGRLHSPKEPVPDSSEWAKGKGRGLRSAYTDRLRKLITRINKQLAEDKVPYEIRREKGNLRLTHIE